MDVTVEIMNGETHEIEIPQDSTYLDIMTEIKMNPESAVAIVDGRPQPEDAVVESSKVKVMRVISGGTAETKYR